MFIWLQIQKLKSMCALLVQEFVDFLKQEAPWIKLHYIPQNCTGRLQPADVGLQKPFKDGARDCFSQYVLSEFSCSVQQALL